jgi:thiol-disulfide isomerase/thioredoxin
MPSLGHVVLVDFWTLTCINWLRTEPYIRAWSQAYRNDGLVVIGVHTPEFSFEHQIGRVRQATKERGIDHPGRGRQRLHNLERLRQPRRPALYFVDTDGIIRDRHVGEGRYEQSERAVQRLLSVERELVCVEGLGVLIGVLGFPP